MSIILQFVLLRAQLDVNFIFQAVFCYWFTSNVITLIQAGLLRIPAVRDFFHIPQISKMPISMTGNQKGFTESMKEGLVLYLRSQRSNCTAVSSTAAWENQKVVAKLNERRALEEALKSSTKKAPPTTYSLDPTRQKDQSAQSIIQRGFKGTKKSP